MAFWNFRMDTRWENSLEEMFAGVLGEALVLLLDPELAYVSGEAWVDEKGQESACVWDDALVFLLEKTLVGA